MDAGDPSPQPRWLGNYAFRDRPSPPSSLLLSSPFLQVISFWIMFYLGSCFDLIFFFFLILHLLDEEVMVGSGPGRGCRWPWSWDSILTQGTGLFTVPFLKKNPTPFPSICPWLEEALGTNSPCLPREAAQCPLAYFFPPSNVSSGQFDHWWSKE